MFEVSSPNTLRTKRERGSQRQLYSVGLWHHSVPVLTIPHWIPATAAYMCCVGFCFSTLPSAGTAGAAQGRNERHSQLCWPAGWHFHQAKRGLHQLLNYLTPEISNSVTPPTNYCKPLTAVSDDVEKRRLFLRWWDLDYSYVERHNTLTLTAPEILAAVRKTERCFCFAGNCSEASCWCQTND